MKTVSYCSTNYTPRKGKSLDIFSLCEQKPSKKTRFKTKQGSMYFESWTRT